MLILGIDTSCDDTSASLAEVDEEGLKVITNVVSGQEEIHKKFGGIVPELASRRHIEMIWPVVEKALPFGHDGLSAVAVCHGPGLIGSLLVGCSFAKAFCYSRGVPLVSVNHLEGHLFSAFLEGERPVFPFISLIVSGGHTCLYKVEGFGRYSELGRTRDDAGGEAFDKVSKLLGLGYPGGPAIERLSLGGNPKAIKFPRAYLPGTLDFSMSGLKTAVLNFVKSRGEIDETLKQDIAASFQAAVVDVLVRKTEWAVKKEGIKRVSATGGVIANTLLRERLSSMAGKRDVSLHLPSKKYCTDNAAMIALAGYHRLMAGETAPIDLNPKAHLPL